MRSNAVLAETLTRFLRRMERTTSADNFFYFAHRDHLIARFDQYLRSPEFAPLDYRIVKNDAFHYLTFYLRNRSVHYWDYEVYLLLFDAQFALKYVDYSESELLDLDVERNFELRRLTFATTDAPFAHLELRKELIAQAAVEISSGEP